MRVVFGKACVGQLQFAVTDVLQGCGDFAVCGFVLPLDRAKAPEVHQRADGDVVHAVALYADFQRFTDDAAQAVTDRLRRGHRVVVVAHQFGLLAVGGHAVVHRFERAVNALLERRLCGRVQFLRDADVPGGTHGFASELAGFAACFFAAGCKQKRCCHQQQRPE